MRVATAIPAALALCVSSVAVQAARDGSTARVRLASAASDPQATSLVLQMLTADQNLSFAGEQVTTIYGANGTSASEQTYIRSGLRGMLIRFNSPPQMAGEERGDNGTTSWHYVPARNLLEQRGSNLQRERGEITHAMRGIRNGRIVLQMIGEDNIAGRHVYIVQASAADGGPGTRRFWIDPTNGAQLRILIFGPNGTPQSDSYFTQITYAQSFAANIFNPPAVPAQSVKVPTPQALTSIPQNDPTLGFNVLQPGYLPAGFSFQSAQKYHYKNKTAIGVRYANGLSIISLYEIPAGPKARNHSKIDKPGTLTGVLNGVRVVIVANLGDPDLIRIYQSLH